MRGDSCATYSESSTKLEDKIFTICKPIDNAGPIPKANIKVPKPTVPPSNYPKTTTTISINVRT